MKALVNKINIWQIIAYIIAMLLNVSVFIYQIPYLQDSHFFFFLLSLQLFIVFYNHNALKSYGTYLVFTGVLIVSHIVNVIIVYLKYNEVYNYINNYQETQDIFATTMAQAAMGIYYFIFAALAVSVIFECIISIIIRYVRHKRVKKI